MAIVPLLLLLTGCSFLRELRGLGEEPPRDCETRQVFYEDTDGDGRGDPSVAYVGCEAPDGWVTTPDTGSPDTDELDTDTDAGDTDTDAGDTDTDAGGDTDTDTGATG